MSPSSPAGSPVQLLGIPYDAHSSHLRGPAEAPTAVREALHSGSANWFTELGAEVDPADGTWFDRGDVTVDNDDPTAVEQALAAIEAAAADALAVWPLLSVGGDHMVTWPLVRAVATRHPDLTIVHVDAHPDLYDHLDGDRFSHACPFDPAYAPGVSHHEPGGLTTRQLLDILHQLGAMPTAVAVGADIVEINPRRDLNGVTAMLGAKLTRELLGLLR